MAFTTPEPRSSPARPGLEGEVVRSDKTGSSQKKAEHSKANEGDRTVGDALRAVYQDAVAESIPDEMLDLLHKLG
ncbi:NepR family anti-sigma factor [Sphingomonas sp.]|uniref:NepR family anti-sigma factor n=1 Tax=Sphingomonas sp. TaxID=28214 RepID=UPI002B7EB46E|nr:NepR family anti-sigma factor [Sphingomonas sp.]HWK35339.1 NepR family anti-sigma factor [Sphingomonas sp.]